MNPSKITQKAEENDKDINIENEGIFNQNVRVFLEIFEGFSKVKDEDKAKGEPAYPYYDSEGIPTIGYGFNLAVIDDSFENCLTPIPIDGRQEWKSYKDMVKNLKFTKKTYSDRTYDYRLKEKFFPVPSKSIIPRIAGDTAIFTPSELSSKKKDLNKMLQTLFPYTIVKKEAKEVLVRFIKDRIQNIKKWRQCSEKTDKERESKEKKKFVFNFLDSYEGLALLSLYYNNSDLIGKGLKNAHKENNRFKMWFEIRYNSNKGKDIGIAKRRFAESNVFGLFENTKRGEGYKNTAKWGFDDKENTNTAGLKETMRFFISLHSKFAKEEKKSYFEYVKHYESKKIFNGESFDDIQKPKDFAHHYKPYVEVFSPFVKTFNEAMKKAIEQTNQETNNSNNQQQGLKFTLENILVVTKDNRTSIIDTINEKSAKWELAIILEKGYDLGFLKYQNQKIKKNKPLHIILSFDNHIDCGGFINSNNMTFYILKDDKIIKLCGSKKPLESQTISFQDTTLKGLMQINKDEGIIYCFKEQANGKFSPNLSIYCKDTFELIATIYNLRSEGDNNA